jgi:protoporphyrin/coproporphyrin ferrochelatase
MAHYSAVAQAAAPSVARIGVLVVNLGTPDAPSYLAVQRYLREFLSDRRVINTSRLIWLPLLYGVILPLRPVRTAAKYRKIWMPEGSPLALYSRRLTEKLSVAMKSSLGDDVCVELAMTYGKPGIASAIERLNAQNIRRLLVLPLYPQYCSATTAPVFDRVAREQGRWRLAPDVRMVNGYHRDPAYIEAWSRRIAKSWEGRGERSHLVLAYHGIPVKYVKQGDPYQMQTQATTHLIAERLNLTADEFSHCYQSRFGRVEWLQPYATDTLENLLKRGVHRLTVASPSFAVDCLETLEELAITYRHQFLDGGGERFDLLPCLNDEDEHAELLAGIIRQNLAGWP